MESNFINYLFNNLSSNPEIKIYQDKIKNTKIVFTNRNLSLSKFYLDNGDLTLVKYDFSYFKNIIYNVTFKRDVIVSQYYLNDQLNGYINVYTTRFKNVYKGAYILGKPAGDWFYYDKFGHILEIKSFLIDENKTDFFLY